MANRVFNDPYLIAHIYGFGDVGHRERMRDIVFETTLEEEIDMFRNSEYAGRHFQYFILFMEDCFTQEERTNAAKKLLRCHCCSRHSHYKHLNHKPQDPLPESKKKECHCYCRHLYRYFRRNV